LKANRVVSITSDIAGEGEGRLDYAYSLRL
jgi:hypothetical protein